jgi:hypothetical protein
MKNTLNESKVTQLLDWAYDRSLAGLPGTPTAQQLGNEYLKPGGNKDEAIDSLIRWQCAKCAISGFLTGLGGLITLPVAVPADLAVNYYVNIRMIAAIAYIRGFDLRDDRVRTMVFMCLLGEGITEAFSKFGFAVGTKLTEKMIERIPGEIFIQINKFVAFRLVTKAGEKGMVNLMKMAPVLGGFIGGGIDAAGCLAIGKIASDSLRKSSASPKGTDPYVPSYQQLRQSRLARNAPRVAVQTPRSPVGTRL